jgi:ABC-2 type transport system ATP-binding protein
LTIARFHSPITKLLIDRQTTDRFWTGLGYSYNKAFLRSKQTATSSTPMTVLTDDLVLVETEQATAAVETYELSKTYQTGFFLNQKVESLKNCTLKIHQGETFGLLGLNGAGKTTLLKSLLGIVRPTHGRAQLFGQSIGNPEIRQRIGYLPENAYFYEYLTGWEVLEFTADIFQIPFSVRRQRIPALLDMVGLAKTAAKKKKMRQYSKGMQQRIGMAQALINDPDIVFLDEPMSGLDPLGRKQMRDIILSLSDSRKTVFFNSHVLTEVEQICTRIGILARGELIVCGTLDEVLSSSDGSYSVAGRGGNSEILGRWLKDLVFDGDSLNGTQRERWHGRLRGEPQEFLATMRLMDAELIEIKQARLSLEDFFMQQMAARGILTST